MIKKLKKINFYPLIPFLFLLLIQNIVYFISKLINHNMYHHIISWKIDEFVPLWTFMIVVYVGCYIWWGITPLVMGKYLSKKRFYQYVVTVLITHIACILIYITFPTTIVRPEIPNTNFFNWLTNLIYKSDVPNNLLPSMHSTISWLCFRPFIKTDKLKAPKWLVLTQFIIAVLVFMSTVTIKQHYIIDVIAAVILVEIIYFIVGKTNWYKPFETFFTKVNKRLKIEK
ncbi:conserved hypothetical protein [Alteracholeplasma palmae J233]|uniref:Inositolphosphotransferase Aur1/Ipt1 domain-containing protein n=1 Tax=Alteracholeplasma palmae (strain ATCC 49389 / J233) TaxID=1318466 RepID=U4KLY4_ALTPJ|nr:phosphatase PAP2 family protein [Alteracholeplasma palmae]CCV64982.1 conserved hypothetical protein [Alteracholeplasma palmae J233]